MDDVAAVMKVKGEFLVLRGCFWKHDLQIIIAAYAAFLEGHAFVLKKGEGFTVLAGDAVDCQGS